MLFNIKREQWSFMYFWKHGEKSRFAKMAGIAPQTLSDILSGKRGVSFKRAQHFEKIALQLLGENRSVPCMAWLSNKTTKHPAFRNI